MLHFVEVTVLTIMGPDTANPYHQSMGLILIYTKVPSYHYGSARTVQRELSANKNQAPKVFPLTSVCFG